MDNLLKTDLDERYESRRYKLIYQSTCGSAMPIVFQGKIEAAPGFGEPRLAVIDASYKRWPPDAGEMMEERERTLSDLMKARLPDLLSHKGFTCRGWDHDHGVYRTDTMATQGSYYRLFLEVPADMSDDVFYEAVSSAMHHEIRTNPSLLKLSRSGMFGRSRGTHAAVRSRDANPELLVALRPDSWWFGGGW